MEHAFSSTGLGRYSIGIEEELMILDGEITLQRGNDQPARLRDGDTFVVPANVVYTISEPTHDAQLLDVTLPA